MTSPILNPTSGCFVPGSATLTSTGAPPTRDPQALQLGLESLNTRIDELSTEFARLQSIFHKLTLVRPGDTVFPAKRLQDECVGVFRFDLSSLRKFNDEDDGHGSVDKDDEDDGSDEGTTLPAAPAARKPSQNRRERRGEYRARYFFKKMYHAQLATPGLMAKAQYAEAEAALAQGEWAAKSMGGMIRTLVIGVGWCQDACDAAAAAGRDDSRQASEVEGDDSEDGDEYDPDDVVFILEKPESRAEIKQTLQEMKDESVVSAIYRPEAPGERDRRWSDSFDLVVPEALTTRRFSIE